MSLARGLALVGALLIVLMPSSVARADTYCVTPAGGCDGPHTFATVQAALTGVAGNGVDDTIQLGATTYTQDNMTYTGSDPVSLVGAGTGSTTLRRATAGSNTKVFNGSGSGQVSLSHLHVHVSFFAASAVSGVTLSSGGSLDDVLIDADAGAYNPDGVTLGSTGSVTHSTVDVPPGGSCINVSDAHPATLTDDLLTHCSSGVNSQSGSTTLIQRLRVIDTTGTGVDVGGGSSMTVEDSLLTFSNSVVDAVDLGASGPNPTSLTANHLTVVGNGNGVGVSAFNHVSTSAATINLYHSIIRGFATSLERDSTATHPASIVADYNDYDVATVSDLGGPGSLTSTHIYNNVDPQFAAAGSGDYHLAPGSPLVDQDPAPLGALESPFDFDGRPRIISGARDLGAFERPTAPTATSGDASAITDTSATLAGVVNPGGDDSTWNVVYGRTSALGSHTTDSPLGKTAGDRAVSTVLTGLTPGTTYHYSFRATNSIGLGFGADRTFTTAAASLSALKLSPKSFAAARSGASLSRVATGSRLRYRLSSAATVTFRVRRLLPGVRAGRRCVARGRKHKSGRRCTRAVLVKGSFKRASTAGANSAHFSGRVGRRALKPGRYRLTGTPAGGKAVSVKFKIVRRTK